MIPVLEARAFTTLLFAWTFPFVYDFINILQLGISDVFEPRTADLSPMSPDLGVYARDIQQSIGVNIRNNMKGGIGGADGGNDGQQQQPPASASLIRRPRRGIGNLPLPLSLSLSL